MSSAYYDDFISQSNETGEIGLLGWLLTNGNLNALANEQNHPGIVRRSTTAIANSICSLYLAGNTNSTLFRFDEFDEMTWIFRLPFAVTDTILSFGLKAAFGVLAPAHGVYLQSLPTDINWFFVCRNNNLETRVDSNIPRNIAWVRIRMRRVSAAEVGFSINGGAEVLVTANVPDAADSMNVGMQITQTGTAVRNVDLDYFSMKLRPLVR